MNDEQWSKKWKWVILLAGWFSFGLFSGTLYTSGLFYVIYLKEFKQDRSTTAWVGSLCSSVYLMYGPLVALSIRKFGCRAVLIAAGILACIAHILNSLATGLTSLYFSYGIFLAVPLALVHTGWIVAIAEVFPETMRGLATGVLMTGGGAGLFLMPPFLDWVIDGYGWRGAYVILGGLSLNWIAAAATIFRVGGLRPGQKLSTKEHFPIFSDKEPEQRKSYLEVVLNFEVIFFNLMSFFWMFSGGTMFIMFKDLLTQRNLEDQYQFCLQLVGIGDLIGRLVAGLASSHPPLNISPLFQYIIMHVLSCLVFLTFCLAPSNIFLIYFLFLMFGITWGAQNLYLAVAPAAVLGVVNISTVLGTFLFSAGLGQLIGPPLFGWLVDATGSYLAAMITATASQGLATVSAVVATYANYRNNA